MATSTTFHNIEKRRRLSALYDRAKPVRFDQFGVNNDAPKPDDVVIMVCPPNPAQRDEAIREAQAARARALLSIKDPESAEHITAKQYIADMTMEDLLDYVMSMEEPKRQKEAQRRVLSGNDWKDYDELRDAMRQWEEAGFPDTEEWRALAKRDRDFGDQVRAEMEVLYEADRESLAMQGRAKLEAKAFERRSDVVGTGAFMRVFEDAMLFFSCRDDEDHQKLFFESYKEVRELPEFVQESLTEALHSFIDDVDEAKN